MPKAPTGAADALAALLATDSGLSGRQIETQLSGEHARADTRKAIQLATASGEIVTSKGPRNATLHSLAKP